MGDGLMIIKVISLIAVFLFVFLGGHERVAAWWRKACGKSEEE